MELLACETYRHFIQARLADRKKPGGGASARLAEKLNCHPTFISQVVRGKSHLNPEQGLKAAEHFQLNPLETEYFMDLLNRDRSTNDDTRGHYQSRLDRAAKMLRNLRERWSLTDPPQTDHERLYARHWIYSAVHCLIQIPECRDVNSISEALGVSRARIRRCVDELSRMGCIRQHQGRWEPAATAFHIGRDSVHLRKFHRAWRTRQLISLEEPQSETDMRFTSVMSISRKDRRKIEQTLSECLKGIRESAVKSKPEDLVYLGLDFTSLSG